VALGAETSPRASSRLRRGAESSHRW